MNRIFEWTIGAIALTVGFVVAAALFVGAGALAIVPGFVLRMWAICTVWGYIATDFDLPALSMPLCGLLLVLRGLVMCRAGGEEKEGRGFGEAALAIARAMLFDLIGVGIAFAIVWWYGWPH